MPFLTSHTFSCASFIFPCKIFYTTPVIFFFISTHSLLIYYFGPDLPESLPRTVLGTKLVKFVKFAVDYWFRVLREVSDKCRSVSIRHFIWNSVALCAVFKYSCTIPERRFLVFSWDVIIYITSVKCHIASLYIIVFNYLLKVWKLQMIFFK